MLFKISALALLAFSTSGSYVFAQSCSFTQATCTFGGSITGEASGTTDGSTNFLGLQSNLGDHVEYSGDKSPVCEGCTNSLTLPGYSYGITNCDDNLTASYTTVNNGIGTTIKECSLSANGQTEDSKGGENSVLGGSCTTDSQTQWYGWGNTVDKSCSCTFTCYKINQQ